VAEDAAERHEGAADRPTGFARCLHLAHDAYHVVLVDLGDAEAAEAGEKVETEGALVLLDRPRAELRLRCQPCRRDLFERLPARRDAFSSADPRSQLLPSGLRRPQVAADRREEGLRVPQRKRKWLRLGESTVPAKRLRAEHPNHVWALDFRFDTTVDGRTLKLLHVVDEHTREALAIGVARSIDADHAVRVLDQIVRERGSAPELVRMDNGPEMTANALRD